MSLTFVNKIIILQFLSFSLTLLEISNVRASSISPDELNVPYVPYVVVDKHKDEFDYERLQDTIVRYLENRPQRQSYQLESSTSLYDYFKTSTNANLVQDHVHRQPPQGAYENVNHYQQQTTSSSEYVPNAYQEAPQQAADTRSMNVYPFRLSDIHPAYHANIYKAGTKIRDGSEVTANFRATTFQPHRYLTTPVNSLSYPNTSWYQPNALKSQPSILETSAPKFVPLKMSYTSSLFAENAPGSGIYHPENDNRDILAPSNVPPFGSEKKCSLKSSRYVYDGGCVSKKPVVETVCADRCIKYEALDGTKKPFYVDLPYKTERQTNVIENKKKVVALSCRDGDVKKQKVKLYCKDGTIINNVIRIVNNCICHEHSEKVHTTKRSHHKHINSRMRMMSRPPMKVRVRI